MPSGGVIGCFGYEYQFYATSLLMLNAHKNDNVSFKLSVETLFGEDAELEHKEDKVLSSTQNQNNIYIQVQVKTRKQTHHWHPADIRELLLKSDESSLGDETVLDKLYSTTNSIFLFITDGSVAETISELLVEQIGSLKHKFGDNEFEEIRQKIIKSDQTGQHKDILTNKLTEHVLSRVFILANLSLDDIERQIREILLWDYGIPTHQIYDKTELLVKMIRDCARRKDERTFITNSDVTNIIGTSGIKLPNQEVESLYQKTDQYDFAKCILQDKHMAVLSGEPGFGKTTLAYKLANELATQHYRFEFGGDDSHLSILRACQNSDNVIFLVDDGFGYDKYQENSGMGLGNNFEQLALQLKEANGRVKVLITSRQDVLAHACENTKLSSSILSAYLVPIPFSTSDFNSIVLKAHLEYLKVKSDITKTVTATSSLMERFENLHHVHSFAYALSDLEENLSIDSYISILEKERPSLYAKWIEQQGLNIQLFLISLWLVSEVNRFASEIDVKYIFEALVDCVGLTASSGFSTHYSNALQNLLKTGRVGTRQGNIVDFIHPTLKIATAQFFESIPGNKGFISCATNLLANQDHPLTQSIMVYLAIHNLDDIEQLEKLSFAKKSKYVQVRDTIIRFGKTLIESKNSEIKQLAEDVYSTNFHPSECSVDEAGYLTLPEHILNDEPFLWSMGMGDWAQEMLLSEPFGSKIGREPDLIVIFQEKLADQSFVLLNPLDRYKFLDWIFWQYENDRNYLDELLKTVDLLSLDPIAFIRQRVAEHINEIIDMPNVQPIVELLSYDSSPYVKIAVLEDVILRNWSNRKKEIQTLWLDLVVSMLDDSIVRHQCTRGLVNESGSLYFYHDQHTKEQIRDWFATIAPKLLKNTFEYDDVDRFLSAFDKHYTFFSTPFRINLLNLLNSYVEHNPFHARNTVPTIEKIIFDKNSSKEEFNILLNLINHIPPIAKSEIGFRLAYRLGELPDKRFIEFMNRPFYIEDPQEYVFERAAIILGYLSSPSLRKELGNLPLPIQEAGDEFEEAIGCYIDKQSDEFKLILLFEVFGHHYASEISASQHSLYLHPTIKNLISEFISGQQDNPKTIALTYSLLTDGYYKTGADSGTQTEWLGYLDILLSSKNIELIKTICNILFQANIDSSVHNFSDWLVILFRILTHPIEDVRLHAASLFDKYFFDIWQDLSSCIYHERKRRNNKVSSLWGDNEFIQYLLGVCPSFKEYIETKILLKKSANIWDNITEKDKGDYIEHIISSADSDKYYLNALIKEFVTDLGEKLTIDHKEKLLAAITPEGKKYNEIDVLGRIKYLHSHSDLRNLLPIFDWSKYIK